MAVERELVAVERVDVERHQGASWWPSSATRARPWGVRLAVDVERELVAVELVECLKGKRPTPWRRGGALSVSTLPDGHQQRS